MLTSVRAQSVTLEPIDESRAMLVKPEESVPFAKVIDIFLRQYPSRTFLASR
jgi:hypothetical protein